MNELPKKPASRYPRVKLLTACIRMALYGHRARMAHPVISEHAKQS